MRDIRRGWLVTGLMLVGLFALTIGAQASSVDYGDVGLAGGFQTGHFGEIWDLTKGDMYIIVKVDLTGMVDDFGGAIAHAWSELGIRHVGSGDFNPTWMAEGAGVWLATDYDWTANTFDPDSPGSPTLDIDDKLILQKGGGLGEGSYNLPSTPPSPGSNHRFWFDRDGVDQWQAQAPLAVDGGTYNTGGIYEVMIRLHADSPTSGTAYMTINGLDQGFETDGNWNTMELTPAGMTFTGDMTNMQVFYGMYGYGATHTVQFGDIVAILTDVVWVDDDWAGSSHGDKVDGHYYGYDAFSTVQDGVDGVGNSTVNVGDGVYMEQVEISKNLTLNGNGAGTIIEAPDILTKYFTTSKDNYPIIWVHDTSDVTLQNFVVDGLGKGNANYRFVGIAFDNAGGTVDNVEIRGIQNTPFSGAQHGVGIYAYNDDGTPRTLVVTNCNIHDFQKNGMALAGNDLTVDVSGNTVTGIGPTPSIAQNGIQVGFGAGGTVSGNTVSDIWYTGGYWGSSGILIYSPAPDVSVTENDLANCQLGIAGYYSLGLSIERNNIQGSEWGINLYNATNTVIHYNSITGSIEAGLWTDQAADATLNWWGSATGPAVDMDDDGVADYGGMGDLISATGDIVIFSPWLGMDPDNDPLMPGVQLLSPIYFIVDDIGPAPVGGYLGTAIAAANNVPGSDLIEVRSGAYADDATITDPVTIESQEGCPSTTFIDGNLVLGSEGIQLGSLRHGFTIRGDLTVGAGINAAQIHVNWNNIEGQVTNTDGIGSLDATYNFWGADGPLDNIAGQVHYYPYLPVEVCVVIQYMDDYGLNPNQAIVMAKKVLKHVNPKDILAAFGLVNMCGMSMDDALALVRDYGRVKLQRALRLARGDCAKFYTQLVGYGVGGGAGGGLLDKQIAGGGGAIEGVNLEASYTQGDTIHVAFILTDPITGDVVTEAVATLSVVRVTPGETREFMYWGTIPYNSVSGQYQLDYDTSGLTPGYYDLYIGTSDGQNQQLRVEIVAP